MRQIRFVPAVLQRKVRAKLEPGDRAEDDTD